MKVSNGDIMHAVGSTYFDRGEAYYSQGRVISLDVDNIDEDTVALYAVVSGSGRKVYQLDISIEQLDDGIIIDGSCTCPMDYNCKHVAAACLAYQQQKVSSLFTLRKPEGDCLVWLDQFEQLASETAPEPSHKDFLIYVLKPKGKTGHICVDLHVTRLLKKGGLSKGRSISLNQISSNYYYPDYMQQEDIRIGKLIAADADIYTASCTIQGEMGAIILQSMMQTGRCFWKDFARPALHLDKPRDISIAWNHHEDGSAALVITVAPSGIPLLTEPAYYLDEQQNCVGLLHQSRHTAKQMESLLNAPTVPVEMLPEFSRRLVLGVATPLLSPPQSVSVEEISAEDPVPHLKLMVIEEGEYRFDLARLRLRYGAHEISWFPETEIRSIVHDQQIVRIHRDQAAEEALVDQLLAIGFEGREHSTTGDLCFLSLADNMNETVNRWHYFLSEVVPELKRNGWQIEFDDDFRMQFHQAERWDINIEEKQSDWFSLRFDIDFNGQRHPLLPIISRVLEEYEPDQLPEMLSLNMGDGDYLQIPAEQLRPVIDILYELYDGERLSEDGGLTLSRFDAGRLHTLGQQSQAALQWHGGDHLRDLGRQLHDFDGILEIEQPQGLRAELRPYQRQGLNWLQFLAHYQLAGILADDMGLGKTIQTLAHLLVEKEQGRLDKPCLIIAPTSLMGNWRREAGLFAPALRVLVLQGADRHGRFEEIDHHDIVLSTYPLLVRDKEQLLAGAYHSLILDEAQTVKNPKAKAAQIIRQINARHRLCLTGTPMENHLGELWALFDFLMPGFLGDLKQFNSMFRTPVEKHGDEASRVRLVQRIAPFMLRRIKSEVIHELPEKTEIIRMVSFDAKQATLYESIRVAMEAKVRNTIASKGLNRSHITILDALLKLRQVCCDPRLLALKQAKTMHHSAKLELLMQLLPEMLEEGRRILLFSQFTKMLGLIETELKTKNINYSKLTGQTRNRDAVIEQFRQGETSLFLISLKAGGVGLNLTEADTVIHYDPWWNPAVENQATDRAHRIGQNKAVFVYKFVVENSVEEKILAMQQQKQLLAQGVYQQQGKAEEFSLTAETLQALLAPL